MKDNAGAGHLIPAQRLTGGAPCWNKIAAELPRVTRRHSEETHEAWRAADRDWGVEDARAMGLPDAAIAANVGGSVLVKISGIASRANAQNRSGTNAGRWTSRTSPAAGTAGAIWWP